MSEVALGSGHARRAFREILRFLLRVNLGMQYDASSLPCIVSKFLSYEIDFCLKMTLPFFNSAMFLGAVAIDGYRGKVHGGEATYWMV